MASFSLNFFWTPKIKPWTIVHGFRPGNENFDFGKKSNHRKGYLKRSRMVQISASYIAPSSEEFMGADMYFPPIQNVHAW